MGEGEERVGDMEPDEASEKPQVPSDQPSHSDEKGDREKSDRKRSRDETDEERRKRKERERERDRDRRDRGDRDRDRDRGRHRRSSSRERRREETDEERRKRKEKEREREKERESYRDRDRDRRENPRSYYRDRRGRDADEDRFLDPAEKEKRAQEKRAQDQERATRTVYVWQLPRKVTEEELTEFFDQFDIQVRDVQLIKDRITNKFKGIGYVEFFDRDMVVRSLQLSGQLLRGKFPIMIKPSEAEKNFVADPAVVTIPVHGPVRVSVEDLPLTLTEHDLKDLFVAFGEVETVRLLKDEARNSRGAGYVYFKNIEDARAAVESLNGYDLAGNQLKVAMPAPDPHYSSGGHGQGMMGMGMGMMGMGMGMGMSAADTSGQHQGSLNTGLIGTAEGRAALMAKLQRGDSGAVTPNMGMGMNMNPTAAALMANPAIAAAVATNPLLFQQLQMGIIPPALAGLAAQATGGTPAVAPAVPAPAVTGTPTAPLPTVNAVTECLLLQNMFDIDSETKEEDFAYEDIEEDVKDECGKFGKILHVFAQPKTPGFVYMRFDSAAACEKARNNLNLRWFASKQITAEFVDPRVYLARFPA